MSLRKIHPLALMLLPWAPPETKRPASAPETGEEPGEVQVSVQTHGVVNLKSLIAGTQVNGKLPYQRTLRFSRHSTVEPEVIIKLKEMDLVMLFLVHSEQSTQLWGSCLPGKFEEVRVILRRALDDLCREQKAWWRIAKVTAIQWGTDKCLADSERLDAEIGMQESQPPMDDLGVKVRVSHLKH